MSFWEEQSNGTFKKIKGSISNRSVAPKKNNPYAGKSKNSLRNELNRISKSSKNLIFYILIFVVLAILVGVGVVFKDKIKSFITGKKEEDNMN